MYIIYKKSHAWNKIVMFGFLYFWGLLCPWKLTFSEYWMNFLSNFVSLVTYLSYIFLLDGSIFTSDEEKEEKINSSTLFEGCYLNLRGKKLEIHKVNRLSITWILKKLKSIQALVKDIPEIKFSHWYLLSKTYKYKKSHSKTRTLIVFFFFYNNVVHEIQTIFTTNKIKRNNYNKTRSYTNTIPITTRGSLGLNTK